MEKTFKVCHIYHTPRYFIGRRGEGTLVLTHTKALQELCEDVIIYGGLPKYTFYQFYEMYARGKLKPSLPPVARKDELIHVLYPSLSVFPSLLKSKGTISFRIIDEMFSGLRGYISPYALSSLLLKNTNFFLAYGREIDFRTRGLTSIILRRLRFCTFYPGFLPERLNCVHTAKKENCVAVIHAFSVEKHIERVIEIAKVLKSKKISVKFIVVGEVVDTQYYEFLLNLRRRYDVEDIVSFIPKGDDKIISKILDRCKCSLWVSEGRYGIVNVESLYCGVRPIVNEKCKNAVGEYGIIYKSLQEIPEIITRCLNEKLDPYKMREYAIKNHTPHAIANQMRECFI